MHASPVLGTVGFFIVGTSIYLRRILILGLPSPQINFFPTRAHYIFLWTVDLFFRFSLWCIIPGNMCSAYDRFGRKKRNNVSFLRDSTNKSSHLPSLLYKRYPINQNGNICGSLLTMRILIKRELQ